MIREPTSSNSSFKRENHGVVQDGFQVPPIDIDILFGNYLKWNSLRDVFAAVYINNSRLSKVEKLFQLNAKTSCEAKDIVSKTPLTNEGFDLAWAVLCHHFGNKSMLINAQL